MLFLVMFSILSTFSSIYAAETEDHYNLSILDSAPLINEVICERLKHLERYYNAMSFLDEPLERDVVILGTGLIKKEIQTVEELKLDIIRKSRNGLAHGLPKESYKQIEGSDKWIKEDFMESFPRLPDVLNKQVFVEPCYLFENNKEDNIFKHLNDIRKFLIVNKIPILSDLGAKGIQNVFRVGDAHISTDKLNHFLNEGTDFFMESKEEDALYDSRKGEVKSVKTELTYFGFDASGVFSYADLEANRKGAQFLYDLVNSNNPAFSITKQGGKFHVKLNKCPDIREYFSLEMNEVYNPSVYTAGLEDGMVKGITEKIKKRALRLGVDLATDFSECSNLQSLGSKEEEVINKIKISYNETAMDELAKLWAICPEKLSFNEIVKIEPNSTKENIDNIIEYLQKRKGISQYFIKNRLK